MDSTAEGYVFMKKQEWNFEIRLCSVEIKNGSDGKLRKGKKYKCL